MIRPRWLSVDEVLRLHDIQIQRYGGNAGIRDAGLLESAVLRPQNKHYCASVEDVVTLAAEYAIGISGNHRFIDGNKRTAFYAMAVFLELNGLPLKATDADATRVMLGLAAKTLDETHFREWLRCSV